MRAQLTVAYPVSLLFNRQDNLILLRNSRGFIRSIHPQIT